MATYNNGDPALLLRDEWLADAGLLRDDGTPNRGAIRERVVRILVDEATVTDARGKLDRALTRAVLTTKVVTSDALAAVASEPSPDMLQQAAFNETAKLVWSETADGPDTPAQRAVGSEVDGGVLVKTRLSLGQASTPAVYVTTNEDLIWSDYVAPRDQKLRQMADRFGQAMAMIATRQPATLKRAESTVNTAAKVAGQHAREEFQLALGAASNGSAPAAEATEAAV